MLSVADLESTSPVIFLLSQLQIMLQRRRRGDRDEVHIRNGKTGCWCWSHHRNVSVCYKCRSEEARGDHGVLTNHCVEMLARPSVFVFLCRLKCDEVGGVCAGLFDAAFLFAEVSERPVSHSISARCIAEIAVSSHALLTEDIVKERLRQADPFEDSISFRSAGFRTGLPSHPPTVRLLVATTVQSSDWDPY